MVHHLMVRSRYMILYHFMARLGRHVAGRVRVRDNDAVPTLARHQVAVRTGRGVPEPAWSGSGLSSVLDTDTLAE